MAEALITDADIERMWRGIELFNAGQFDGLREFISPDVVVERVGGLPSVHGWDAFRAMQEPDAFAWQKLHPVEWTVIGDRVLLKVRIISRGAGSGVELEVDGWMVWTVADHLVIRIASFTEEAEARAAAWLGQNASS